MGLNAYAIVGQRRDSGKMEMIAGPLTPAEKRDAFMPLQVAFSDPDYEKAWLVRFDVEREVKLAPPSNTSEPTPTSVEPEAKKKKRS